MDQQQLRIDSRPTFRRNHQIGHGDQTNGIRLQLENIGNVVLKLKDHPIIGLVILAVVAIVALALGMTLGLHGEKDAS